MSAPSPFEWRPTGRSAMAKNAVGIPVWGLREYESVVTRKRRWWNTLADRWATDEEAKLL